MSNKAFWKKCFLRPHVCTAFRFFYAPQKDVFVVVWCFWVSLILIWWLLLVQMPILLAQSLSFDVCLSVAVCFSLFCAFVLCQLPLRLCLCVPLAHVQVSPQMLGQEGHQQQWQLAVREQTCRTWVYFQNCDVLSLPHLQSWRESRPVRFHSCILRQTSALAFCDFRRLDCQSVFFRELTWTCCFWNRLSSLDGYYGSFYPKKGWFASKMRCFAATLGWTGLLQLCDFVVNFQNFKYFVPREIGANRSTAIFGVVCRYCARMVCFVCVAYCEIVVSGGFCMKLLDFAVLCSLDTFQYPCFCAVPACLCCVCLFGDFAWQPNTQFSTLARQVVSRYAIFVDLCVWLCCFRCVWCW